MGLQSGPQKYISVSYTVVRQKTLSKITKTADRIWDLSAYGCQRVSPVNTFGVKTPGTWLIS